MTKIIIVSACCRTIQDVPVIQKEDVEFGYKLIMYYFDTIGEVVDKYIFENKTQMNSQKILNIISDSGNSIAVTELYKSTRFLNKREREAIIEDLLASNLITRDLESIDGQQTIILRRV